MIRLIDAASGGPVGTLTDEQFAELVDALEEESSDDQDYYINTDTLAVLEQRGGSRELIQALRTALGGRQEMDLAWEQEDS